MNGFHQLLAQADGISLRNKDHTVECIGNDKHGQNILIGEIHGFSNLLLNAIIHIYAISNGRRQPLKLYRMEFLILFFGREKEDYFPTPFLELAA